MRLSNMNSGNKQNTRRRAPTTAVRQTGKSVKIAVDFPAPLYRETERAVRELSMNRSLLIRCAVEKYLADIRREKLEKELAAGYIANDAQATMVAEEFAKLDADFV